MRKQTVLGTTDGYLNLTPSVLLGPPELEGTIEEVLYNKLRQDSGAAVDNRWAGKLTHAVHALLSVASTPAWYLAARKNAVAGVEIAFLEGEETPQVKTETEFGTGDVRTAVVHTVAAKALDYRGLYKNPGA